MDCHSTSKKPSYQKSSKISHQLTLPGLEVEENFAGETNNINKHGKRW